MGGIFLFHGNHPLREGTFLVLSCDHCQGFTGVGVQTDSTGFLKERCSYKVGGASGQQERRTFPSWECDQNVK